MVIAQLVAGEDVPSACLLVDGADAISRQHGRDLVGAPALHERVDDSKHVAALKRSKLWRIE